MIRMISAIESNTSPFDCGQSAIGEDEENGIIRAQDLCGKAHDEAFDTLGEAETARGLGVNFRVEVAPSSR
jgi:hypothetical protein